MYYVLNADGFSVTKSEEKLQNIKDAMDVFEKWLKGFEKSDLKQQNRAYLPLSTIELLLSLKIQHKIKDYKAEAFVKAYKLAGGDYKQLRTVVSAENEPTWDIVRNTALKKLIEKVDEEEPDMWDGDLPTKAHLELILWGYSPEASKLKKQVPKIEEKLGKSAENKEAADNEIPKKRKSAGSVSGIDEDEDDDDDDVDEEDSPKKKTKK